MFSPELYLYSLTEVSPMGSFIWILGQLVVQLEEGHGIPRGYGLDGENTSQRVRFESS